MKNVFIAGGVSYDSIIYVDNFPETKPQTIFSKNYNETVGSTGAGKALNLSRLNFKTTLHTMLGNDEKGEKVKRFFDKENMEFMYDEDEEGTKTHTNIMDNNGGRISIFTSYGTFEPEINLERLEEKIAHSDYLVLNIINYVRYLIPIAKKHNKEIWCDIHDYNGNNDYYDDFIKNADYLFMSSDSMKDYKGFMEKMIGSGKKLVVCTHGKNGATALTNDGNWIDIPIAEGYERVDTNGAGDSFFSGVMYGISKGYSVEESLKYGTISAGLCVTSHELVFEKLSEELIESEYKKLY